MSLTITHQRKYGQA
jgi:RNA polymerase sigma-70 factor, ECF subfamily